MKRIFEITQLTSPSSIFDFKSSDFSVNYRFRSTAWAAPESKHAKSSESSWPALPGQSTSSSETCNWQVGRKECGIFAHSRTIPEILERFRDDLCTHSKFEIWAANRYFNQFVCIFASTHSGGRTVAFCNHCVCVELFRLLDFLRRSLVFDRLRTRWSNGRREDRRTPEWWSGVVCGRSHHFRRFPSAEHRNASLNRFRWKISKRRMSGGDFSHGCSNCDGHRYRRGNGWHRLCENG